MQKFGQWMSGYGAVVAGVAMMTACAGQSEPGAASRAPIAEVALDNGGNVQFFETKPGTIQIVQSAPIGAPDVTNAGLSALALYQQLAPGRAAPAALVEAQQRVNLARASQPAHTAKPAAELDRPVANLANNTTFENTFCVGSWDVIHCVVDRTSGYFWEYSSTDAARCTVSVDTGVVTFHLLEDGDEIWTRDLFAGSDGATTTVSFDSGTFNDDLRCEVRNVGSGDRFDAAFRFNID
jgi:hypothetical protein